MGKKKKDKTPPSRFSKIIRTVALFHAVIFVVAGGVLANPLSLVALQEVPENWALDPEAWTARPWTLLTGALMHAGLLHLAVNMYALYDLSRLVTTAEQIKIFVAGYLGGLVFSAAFIVLLSSGNPTVGASGAIFGVGGALFASWSFEHLRSGMWLFLGLNMAITFTVPFISWQAHLGGFVGGYLVGVAYNYWNDRDHFEVIRETRPEVAARTRSYYMVPQILTVLGSHRASDILTDRFDEYILKTTGDQPPLTS